GRMPVTAVPSVGTMAVSASGEEVRLLHNPGFVLRISVAELVGVLLHEVHHCVFGHLAMSDEDYPNRPALGIAQEVTANEFIADPLPKGGVLLKHYPMLPPRESTEERYKRLAKVIPTVEVVVTLDDHGAWRIDCTGTCTGKTKAEVEAAVRQAVEDALASVDPAKVPKELRDALDRLGIGDTPGDVTEDVARGRGRLDWRRLLRRYAGEVLEVRPVFTRPPRRFPELVGILPGRGRQAGKPKVMAVIDTSGSISSDALEAFDDPL